MSLTLLIWDGPNIDATLGEFLNRTPKTGDRPDFRALGSWLVDRARVGTAPDMAVEACVFSNIRPGNFASAGWARKLLGLGYRFFAKPKLSEDSDIDDDMVAHVRARLAEGELGEVIAACQDKECFEEVFGELRERGVKVTVLGFEECSGRYVAAPSVEFIDLEAVPGLFPRSVGNRIRFRDLPPEGRWFDPANPLGHLAPAPAPLPIAA